MIKEIYKVEREDFINAGKVSSKIKTILKELQVPGALLRKIAVACYEAEINMVIHSYGGKITLHISEDGLVHLLFEDTGPGIKDLNAALTPGFSTASDKAREMGFGAGMGLPNIRRVSEFFDVKSSSEGTTLDLRWQL